MPRVLQIGRTGRSKQMQYKQMSMVQHCVKAISTWRLSDLKNLKISCETCSVGSREIACMVSYGTPWYSSSFLGKSNIINKTSLDLPKLSCQAATLAHRIVAAWPRRPLRIVRSPLQRWATPRGPGKTSTMRIQQGVVHANPNSGCGQNMPKWDSCH